MIKSELIQDILFLIIITFLVQYFIISRIITSSNEYITNSLNKIYLSTIVAIFVPLIYILMLDFKQGTISCNYYIGLGIVIIASMAYQTERDTHLKLLSSDHLFASNTTRIAVRKGHYLRGYAYKFIELCVPSLTEAEVKAALKPNDQEDI